MTCERNIFMPQLKRVCKNIDPHQCSMSNTSTAARQKCVKSLLKMVCDLTVVRDEDMHACSGDVLHVGGHNGAFGEAMILPVSLPPQLWNLHMTVAPLFLFKSGSPWYLHQGTQTCSTCWDFISWLEQQFHFHRTVKPGHRQLTSPIPVGKVKHMIIVLLYWSNQYSLNRAMNKSTH